MRFAPTRPIRYDDGMPDTSGLTIFTHADCLGHAPAGPHPEHPGRLSAVLSALDTLSVPVRRAEPRPATPLEIGAVHTREHFERVSLACGAAPGMIDADTYVSEGSLRAALLAAGAARDAARAALAGSHAAAIVRPPGHHATRDRAMGFCLFNNAALAAVQSRRTLIVDWDVHHGNGTQEIFYGSENVLFFSAHRWPFYPGTGARDETGTARGLGHTINRPFPWNTGRSTFLAEFAEVIEGPGRAFDPELVVISAGFDAWKNDPVGGLNLEVEDFAELTRIVLGLRRPVVSVLEGGYDVEALPLCVAAHLEALAAPPAP